MRMMEMMDHMATADFEVAFMEHMIEHHKEAIKASEKLMKHAYHQALLDMAEDIIEAQSDEIEMMQMWLWDWYGVRQAGVSRSSESALKLRNLRMPRARSSISYRFDST
jgi:uncharacterized membrane protein YheB (UPF0754 family)